MFYYRIIRTVVVQVSMQGSDQYTFILCAFFIMIRLIIKHFR